VLCYTYREEEARTSSAAERKEQSSSHPQPEAIHEPRFTSGYNTSKGEDQKQQGGFDCVKGTSSSEGSLLIVL
jgi:hypothetical protein